MTTLWFETKDDAPAWLVKDGGAEQAAFRDKTTAILFCELVDGGQLAEAVAWKEKYGV